LLGIKRQKGNLLSPSDARDITERTGGGAARERDDCQLHFDNSAGFTSKSLGQCILASIYQAKSFFHTTKEEAKTDYDFFPKEMADVFRANDQRVFETKSPLSV